MDIIAQIQGYMIGRRWRTAWSDMRLDQWPADMQPYVQAGPADINEHAKIPLLAIDLETTGLDAARDTILSAGWVAVDGGLVRGQTAAHYLIEDVSANVHQTAAVHGILDSTAGDISCADMLVAFFKAAAGRALLAHHAEIELRFIARACRDIYGCVPPLLALDTLRYARAVMGAQKSLRLIDLRRDFGLPDYQNHHALSDAHSAAELWLVLQQKYPVVGVASVMLARQGQWYSTKVV